MKKIIALILTVMMFFTMVSFEASAEEILTPVSIYAGARTITVEYGSKDITAENIGEIVLTTLEGEPVNFTTKINDEFLTIIAETEFVRDTQNYLLEIGGAAKIFKIKTLFTPNFVADTANSKVSDLHITAADNGAVVDVVDNNTVILATSSGDFVIDYDEIVNYENASLVADVHYIDAANTGSRAALAYNVTNKVHKYAYVGQNASDVKRALWYLDGPNGRYYDRMIAISNGTKQSKDKLLAYYGFASGEAIPSLTTIEASEMRPAIRENSYGTAIVSGTATVGTTQLPADFDRETRKYHYVIDKMGAVGTLMMNDTFIDIMDSQDYYDEYNEINKDSDEKPTPLDAPTKGYFVINPLSSKGNGRIILSNMALITSEMKDYEGVEIKNVTYLNANGEELDTIVDVAAVKGEVTVVNRYAVTKSVKLVAVAYAGNRMIGIDILDINSIPANQPATREYSFTGLEGLTQIKVIAWESFAKMYPYCAPVVK